MSLERKVVIYITFFFFFAGATLVFWPEIIPKENPFRFWKMKSMKKEKKVKPFRPRHKKHSLRMSKKKKAVFKRSEKNIKLAFDYLKEHTNSMQNNRAVYLNQQSRDLCVFLKICK